jgi:hypothetical protein
MTETDTLVRKKDIVQRLRATGGNGQGGSLKAEAADLIEKLREALRVRRSDSDVERVLAALPPDEVFHAKQVVVTDMDRKRVFNALGHLCRRGDIARIGYGKFQRPPDPSAQMRQETTSEHIARDIREGRFPAKSEVQSVEAKNPSADFDPASEAAYYASAWQLSTPRMQLLEEAFRRARKALTP